ncbi:MAG: histidine kinase [Oscillospiraceae bacterium]
MLKKPFMTLFNIKKSIQAKIFITFMMLIVFTIISITIIWCENVTRAIESNAISHIQDVIKSSNSRLEDKLSSLDNIIKTISNDRKDIINIIKNPLLFQESSYKQEVSTLLEPYFAPNANSIYGICIADLNGNFSKSGNPYLPTEYMNTDWVKNIISGNGENVYILKNLHTSATEFDHSKKSYLTLGKAILEDENVIGFIFIDIKPSVIISAYGTNMMNGIATSLIIDKNSNIIFWNNNALAGEDINNLIKTTPQSINEYTVQKLKINGLVQFVVSNTSAYTDWTSIVLVPNSVLEKQYINAIKETLFYAVIILLLVIIISMLLSLNITYKLKRLRNFALYYKDNNFVIPDELSKIHSEDEVGELAIAFSDMLAKINQQMLDIKQQDKQKRKYEIEALQAQINPHFLYNTLNTIKHLGEIQNANNICCVTTSLISLLKYSVNSEEKFVDINSEIEYIKNYMNIQQYRYFREIPVIYDIEEAILNKKTIKMLLQPIVENSLKHGLAVANEDSYIIIKGYQIENEIEFKIIDNGTGIPEDKLEKILTKKQNGNKFGGIGLANVNKRIKLFFGENYGINIDSIENVQTIVSINMPIISEGENTDDL